LEDTPIPNAKKGDDLSATIEGGITLLSHGGHCTIIRQETDTEQTVMAVTDDTMDEVCRTWLRYRIGDDN
jgi:hypothetical protein